MDSPPDISIKAGHLDSCTAFQALECWNLTGPRDRILEQPSRLSYKVNGFPFSIDLTLDLQLHCTRLFPGSLLQKTPLPMAFPLHFLKLSFLPVQCYHHEKPISYLSSHSVFILGLWQIINPILEINSNIETVSDLPLKVQQVCDQTSLNHTHTHTFHYRVYSQKPFSSPLKQPFLGCDSLDTAGKSGNCRWVCMTSTENLRAKGGKKGGWSGNGKTSSVCGMVFSALLT